MISWAKIKGRILEETYRILKVDQYGAKTADDASPFGVDANPIDGMTAVFAESDTNGNAVIIGYIDKNKLAEIGELRLYSLSGEDALAAYLWLKADGKIHFNADTNFLVHYNELKQLLEQMENQINTELGKIQIAIAALGGNYPKTNVMTTKDGIKCDDLLCK